MRAHTSVGFINDHEVGTGPREPLPSLLCLDVIEADNRVGVSIEKVLSERQISLETCRCAGSHRDCVDSEPILELDDPLIHEVGRAKNRECIDFSAVHELPQDQARFDGLTDTDIVRDARALVGELERFSPELLDRERWLVLTKTDLLDPEEVAEKKKALLEGLQWDGPVFEISALTDIGLRPLTGNIMDRLDEIDMPPVLDDEEDEA